MADRINNKTRKCLHWLIPSQVVSMPLYRVVTLIPKSKRLNICFVWIIPAIGIINFNQYDNRFLCRQWLFLTQYWLQVTFEKQTKGLVTHADKFLTDEDSELPVFLEPEAVQLLSFWCWTLQQMRRFICIILNAKYTVEKEHKHIGVYIPLDDEELKTLMTNTLRP